MFWYGFQTQDCLCFSILHERLHAVVYVWVDVIRVAPVIHLCLIQNCVHMPLTADASPLLILKIFFLLSKECIKIKFSLVVVKRGTRKK